MPGDEAPSSIPTQPPPTDLAGQRRARAGRRAFVTLLLAFLAAGAFGLVGVRSRTASASGGGYQLSLHYASVARPGLDVPWSLEVHRAGGFPEGLTLAVSSDYLDSLNQSGVSPRPVSEATDGQRTIWRFGPPPGDVLAISVDAQIASGVQLKRLKGRVDVVGTGGATPVGLPFSTFVMP